jgi:hypothetical protein
VSQHPLNLAIRFLLEIIALIALALWGWRTNEGAMRFVWALGPPLVAALVWGVFRVPNDPGDAPVAIPGWLRLLLELAFFVSAVLALRAAGWPLPAMLLAAIVILHYLVSYDRVLWLLRG